MGIRFACPNGHKLNVKEHLAGKRGICPSCGAKFLIPTPPPVMPHPTVSTGGMRSDEFGPPSGLIQVSNPRTDVNELDEIPDAVVVGIPVKPIAPPLPSPSIPHLPTDPDFPRETGTAAPPIAGPVATPGPSIEELYLPPLGAAPVDTVVPEPSATEGRQGGRQVQLLLAIVLLLVVILLAGVLIWVLRRDSQKETAIRRHEIRIAEFVPQPYIVEMQAG